MNPATVVRQGLHQLYKRIETARPSLYYLFFEITRRCNLSCRHCGSDCSAETGFPELSLDSWKSIIDYVASRFSPPPAIVITGGEPFMRKDLPDIAEHMGRRGLRWGMVSNGFQLDFRLWDTLIHNGLESVTISLDGSPETHRYLRIHPESYQRAVSTLSYLSASCLTRLDVVSCVHPAALKALDETAEKLCELKVPSWRLFRIFPSGRAGRSSSLCLSSEQSREMLEWIAQRRPALKKQGLDVQLSCEGYVPFSLDKQLRSQPFFCRAGINIASILSDGSITGCSNNHPDFVQGSVLHDDFADVWLNRFNDFRTRDWIPDGACRSCQEWQRCQGSSMHLWNKSMGKPAFCYLDC